MKAHDHFHRHQQLDEWDSTDTVMWAVVALCAVIVVLLIHWIG